MTKDQCFSLYKNILNVKTTVLPKKSIGVRSIHPVKIITYLIKKPTYKLKPKLCKEALLVLNTGQLAQA